MKEYGVNPAKRQWYDDFGSIDDGGLRMSFLSNDVFSQPAGGIDIGPLEENPTERLDAEWNKVLAASGQGDPSPSSSEKRKTYDDWYQAVSAHTNRQLTQPSDKLPALAGAAVRFNSFISDNYVAGIWASDLPQGLQWSRSAFEAVKVDPSVTRRPGVGGWGESGTKAGGVLLHGHGLAWTARTLGATPAHIGPCAVMTKPSGVERTADWNGAQFECEGT
jgi:hypothetical protein